VHAIGSTTAFAVAQQGAQDAKQEKQDKQTQEDEPLFTKKSGYKSSTTTKESATLAFNGIDRTGR
jgi:hypothetical protein